MNYDIAIGIPTFNEEDSIENVTRIIDDGVERYFPNKKVLIVNIDSKSSDKTRAVFMGLDTRCEKVSLECDSEVQGKGANLFTFIEYGLEVGAKSFATFDGDLTSIESDWVEKTLKPIVTGEAEYITPLYTRNRYEGNTTNHFCVPYVRYVFGKNVSQPIGGEFAFSNKFAKYISEADKPEDSFRYGIDIFLTTMALSGGFVLKEVFLGKKKHKPSFDKMVPMFQQVAGTVVAMAHGQYRSEKKAEVILCENQKVIDEEYRKPDVAAVLQRRSVAVNMILEIGGYAPDELRPIIDLARDNNFILNKQRWEVVLKVFFDYITFHTLSKLEVDNMVKIITPLYLFRALTYYDEIENKEIGEIEEGLRYTL